MNTTIKDEQQKDAVLNIEAWKKRLSSLKTRYQNQSPFPHIVLDQFLTRQGATDALQAFPKVKDEGWIHYVHYNEKKHGLNKMDLLPTKIQELIQVLNSQECVEFLSELTGIKNLIPDDSLEGGGLHQSQRDGFLNIHADFTVHPHKRYLRRRVNLLIYLNQDWEDHYNGHLELWSRDMKRCVQKISPIFNRCVIFNTDEDSYHGLPEPIQCPEDMTRKSIALYYFTEEDSPVKRSTNYRARPGDGVRGLFIYLDKQLIALYSKLKGWLGINDDFASKVLNFFNRKKNK